MPTINKKYFSKVLLIGEYTVTSGYSALALPYDGFSGYWTNTAREIDTANGLKLLLNYMVSSQTLRSLYDVEGLDRDIENGLVFDSDIPTGYGLGSSGALVAGVFDKYALHKTSDIDTLKHIFAMTESAFHGTSSGIDPLVSYLHSPIQMDKEYGVKLVDLDISGFDFYLIDTCLNRKTAPLVELYKQKMATDTNFAHLIHHLGATNQRAIDHILNRDTNGLMQDLYKISRIQFEYFKEMIPQHILPIWKAGMESGDYFIKLCGAGGGGMMLCYHPSDIGADNRLKGLLCKKLSYRKK